jgi:chorismate dehydratase
MKSKLAVSEEFYLQPLLYGLEKPDSPFDLHVDLPARNALNLSERSGSIRNAFLSPIDFARHGGEYCILPHICVASSQPTGTIQLVVKPETRNIKKVAVDIRHTSEIILAKIILSERFKNVPSEQSELVFLPMMPDVDAMLAKADAALIVQQAPVSTNESSGYVLDLVEEWTDLSGLPYVHGFWVGREGELTEDEAVALYDAKHKGVSLKEKIAEAYAQQQNIPLSIARDYLAAFSYDMGETEVDSIREFFHYAYYHGVIGDVPEVQLFDLDLPGDHSPHTVH